ncbi:MULTISPECIES: hypothetical protein [Aphanothece]|uniref:hypothetical protein n=1 Tax=Aphanothece TaxID=1121 RepID=UPI00398EA5CC
MCTDLSDESDHKSDGGGGSTGAVAGFRPFGTGNNTPVSNALIDQLRNQEGV